MEESTENTESHTLDDNEALAIAMTRDQEHERYFEILQNYELERLQKESRDKEAEERLLRDIDLAKKLSLEQDELEEAISNGNEETQVMELNSHRRRSRNFSNHSNSSHDSDQDENISVATPQSDFVQDEEDYAHELKVLIDSGIIPSRDGVSRTVNGHHSPQPRRQVPRTQEPRRDSIEEGVQNADTAVEVNDDEINGLLMDFLNPYPFDNEGIPKNWDKSNIPLSGSSELYRLTELVQGQDEYETIATDFCMSDLEVVKIERLQSPTLLGRFRGEQDHLLNTRPSGFQLNLRYLYHGTTCDKLRVCEEGLDARLGMTGCFGRGIYFSDKPKKCVQYAGRDVGRHGRFPFILMCRVILGHAKHYSKGEMDRTLKREPEKESPAGGWRFYDSVKGCPIDFNEFVVYENRRAMIEYIITFKNASKPFEQETRSRRPVTTPLPIPQRVSSVSSGADDEDASASASVVVNDDSDDDDEFTRSHMSPEMWDRMKRIEVVRESGRQIRAEEKGEDYVGLTREQKWKDRIMWRKVLRINHSPGACDYVKVPELKPRPQTNPNTNNNQSGQQSETSNGEASSRDDASRNEENTTTPTEADLESIKEVESMLISDFLAITHIDDVATARLFLERCAMVLDQAITLYYEEKT